MSYPRQIRFERREAVEIVRRREADRDRAAPPACRARSARSRRRPISGLSQTMRLQRRRSSRIAAAEQLRRAGVVAVGEDHHAGARMDDPPRVPAVEGGEALADLRAAADALRHQRQPVERAGGIALAQRRRHMREAGMEQERLGLRGTPARPRAGSG